jgi:hypothetical protein
MRIAKAQRTKESFSKCHQDALSGSAQWEDELNNWPVPSPRRPVTLLMNLHHGLQKSIKLHDSAHETDCAVVEIVRTYS